MELRPIKINNPPTPTWMQKNAISWPADSLAKQDLTTFRIEMRSRWWNNQKRRYCRRNMKVRLFFVCNFDGRNVKRAHLRPDLECKTWRYKNTISHKSFWKTIKIKTRWGKVSEAFIDVWWPCRLSKQPRARCGVRKSRTETKRPSMPRWKRKNVSSTKMLNARKIFCNEIPQKIKTRFMGLSMPLPHIVINRRSSIFSTDRSPF